MRNRTRKGNGRADKAQPQAPIFLDDGIVITSYEAIEDTVVIGFESEEMAKEFERQLKIEEDLQRELEDYEEDPMEGVKRTLKV